MIQFPKPSLKEFYRTYSIGTFDVSEDEQQIAMAANLSGKFNLWGMHLPNTFPYPLTYEDQMPQFVHFDPQGRFLLVGFDQDGDENTQIYAISPDGGALVPIRTTPGRRHFLGALSKDGNRLYYTSDKENERFMNVYRFDIASGTEETLVVGREATTTLDSVVPDESSFTYVKAYSNTHVLAYAVVNGETICLTPDDRRVQQSGETRYVDSNTIVFITNYEAEFSYLATFDLSTRTFRPLFQPSGEDVGRILVNERGQVFCTGERGVEDVLYEGGLTPESFHPVSFPGAVFHAGQLHKSGRLYAIVSQENVPANLYRRELDGTWTQLTNIRVMGAPADRLGRAETLRFPSFDGLSIEALLWRAPADQRNGHTLVFPHGGPQSADRKFFWSLYQFLLSEGYDIFQVNYRGSTGYGARFTKMIERDWGGAPRRDMIAGIEYLLAQGLADRDKLFVIGASYGGYMTLLLHGRHADYFRAAVDIFGPSNLFSFYDSVPEFWKPMMDAWVGNPEQDKEKMTEDSPITYLDGMTKPMLVIQGANDPRVVKAESDQIVEKLRAAGRDVEYIVLDDEGHGFSKKENELKVYQAVADFLRRHQAM
ncbi:MAG: S9 family peptidase [Alicyclobacillus sp.]|nr:S9 family peptidase [Alicyclobacillus sp.]